MSAHDETKTLLGMSQRRERRLDGILTQIADSLGTEARGRILIEDDVITEVERIRADLDEVGRQREAARRMAGEQWRRALKAEANEGETLDALQGAVDVGEFLDAEGDRLRAEVARLRAILDMGGTGDEARAAAVASEERRISDGMELRGGIERLRTALAWSEEARGLVLLERDQHLLEIEQLRGALAEIKAAAETMTHEDGCNYALGRSVRALAATPSPAPEPPEDHLAAASKMVSDAEPQWPGESEEMLDEVRRQGPETGEDTP